MIRGNFFTIKQPDRPGLPGWWHIRLKVESFPQPDLVKDGSVGISGWQLEEHAERYLAEFTELELKQLEGLTISLWMASPEGGEKSQRWKISSQIERLKHAVQKRCGKELRDS